MRIYGISGIILAASVALAHADAGSTLYPYNGSFDDATFSVESAIVDQGLVIDYVSHVGEMLNRTGKDVGSTKKIFDAADVFLFCSAVVSRQVMEADPTNVMHCPYGIFVTDQDGKVSIGHRIYPEGEMQQVQTLLESIVKTAIDE